MNKIEYCKKAAADSTYNADQWFRYLRKIVKPEGCLLSKEEVQELLDSSVLTMYQKVTLKRAVYSGTPTNKKVISLNQEAKTPMLNYLRRKYNHDQ